MPPPFSPRDPEGPLYESPRDTPYLHASRAFAHRPHELVLMVSGNSAPPIFMWICPVARCNAVMHTFTREAPTCSGGFPSNWTR